MGDYSPGSKKVDVEPSPFSSRLVERWTGLVLRLGVWGSALLIVLGLLTSWVLPPESSASTEIPSISTVLGEISSGSFGGATLMFAGLILLMLTPFLRVLIALTAFAAERDWKFAGISLVVFILLVGELVFSLR